MEQAAWDEQRLRLYAVGRDHLLAHGYEQVSMRMFRRADAPRESQDGPEDYACQTDGMIGLGCGARSYTAALHYSFDYAVNMGEIRSIIDGFTATEDFSRAEVGRYVDAAEARRRHLLQSLLQAAGLPWTTTAPASARTPVRTSPPSWRGSRTGAGWTRGRPRHPAALPAGAGALGRAGSGAVLPGVRAAMAAYERK